MQKHHSVKFSKLSSHFVPKKLFLQCVYKFLQRGWKHAWTAKSTYWSYKGPAFGTHVGQFTIAYWAAHNCSNSSPRGATTSGLPRHLRSDAHTHTQTHMQTHAFKDSCIKVRHDSTYFLSPVLERKKQADLYNFEASLSYIVKAEKKGLRERAGALLAKSFLCLPSVMEALD